MDKLLIATTNPGKLDEIRLFLAGLPVTLLGLRDVHVEGQPEETGTTFDENARIKALWYAERSGMPTIADDGGLEIDALGGEPGVHSHRWVHQDREDTDRELIDYTLTRMAGVPEGKRTARLRVVIAFALPGRVIATETGSVEGIIPDRASDHLTPGFPYRSLLYIPDIGKYYDHEALTPGETDRYNHRKAVLAKLRPAIAATLGVTDRGIL